MISPTPRTTLFPYTTLFRSSKKNLWKPVRLSPKDRKKFATASMDFYRTKTLKRVEAFKNKFGENEREVINGISVPTTAKLRSEEHTSELQSRRDLVCRLLLE